MLNWGCFKAKNNYNLEEAFEQMCYFVFCNKYNEGKSIYAYLNQHYIETEPIKYSEETIGFQSKFYEGSISPYIDELKDKIAKSKEKYPQLTELLFYTFQPFSQSSKIDKNKPTYEDELIQVGKNVGIRVTFQTKSNLEQELEKPENKYIKDLFFNLNPEVEKYIMSKIESSKSYLENIKSEIDTEIFRIKFNRDNELHQFRTFINSDTKNVLVIKGKAGCGKTALIKDFINASTDLVSLIFKSSEFDNCNDISFSGGNVTANYKNLIDCFKNEKKKVLFIESGEKLFDIKNNDVFPDVFKDFLINGWKVVFTCRELFVDTLELIISPFNPEIEYIQIETPSKDTLMKSLHDIGLNTPKDEKLLELLRTPFYLDCYLKFYDKSNENFNIENFKNYLWKNIICDNSHTLNGINIKRQKVFLSIVERTSLSNSYLSDIEELDSEAINLLERDQVISKYSPNIPLYKINNDIFEEWGISKIIEIKYTARRGLNEFIKSLGDSLIMRRCFRNYILDQIELNNSEFLEFIKPAIYSNKITNSVKDNIVITFLKSESKNIDLTEIFSHIDEDFLLYLIKLLKLACNNSKIPIKGKPIKNYCLDPIGNGWGFLIKFIYKNIDNLMVSTKMLEKIIDFLQSYVFNETKRMFDDVIAETCLYIFEYLSKQKKRIYDLTDNTLKQLFMTICQTSNFIQEKLSNIFNRIIEQDLYYENVVEKDFVAFIMNNSILCCELFKNNHSDIIKLCAYWWKKHPTKERFPFYNHNELEDEFGVEKYVFDRFAFSSAYLLPTYWLLKYNLKETLDFLIDFINYSVEEYFSHNKEENDKFVLNFRDEKHEINSSIRIWNMYRGNQVNPHLLECVHMALEKFLLNCAENVDCKTMINIFEYVLDKTKSSSLISIILSVTIAQKDKLWPIALELFKTPKILDLDLNRFVLEQASFKSHNFMVFDKNSIYYNEREEEDKKNFRKQKFEEILLGYFFQQDVSKEVFEARKAKLINILDTYYDNYSEIENPNLFFALSRIDFRKMKVSEFNDNGKLGYIIESQHSDTLENLSKKSQEEQARTLSPLLLRQKYIDMLNNDSLSIDQKTIWKEYNLKINFKLHHELSLGLELKALQILLIIKNFYSTLSDYKIKKIKHDLNSLINIILNNYSAMFNFTIKHIIDVLIQLYNNEKAFIYLEKIIKLIPLTGDNFKINWAKLEINTESRKKMLERSFNYFTRHKNGRCNKDYIKLCSLINLYDMLDLKIDEENTYYTILNNICKLYCKYKKQTGDTFKLAPYINFVNLFDILAFTLLYANYDIKKFIILLNPIFLDNHNFAWFLKCVLRYLNSKNENRFWIIWENVFNFLQNLDDSTTYSSHGKMGKSNSTEVEEYFLVNACNLKYSDKVKKLFNIGLSSFSQNQSFLYAVAKYYSTNAQCCREDGISLIYHILEQKKFSKFELKDNTLLFIENLLYKFYTTHYSEMEHKNELKDKIVSILDYLVEQEMPFAFLLRDCL